MKKDLQALLAKRGKEGGSGSESEEEEGEEGAGAGAGGEEDPEERLLREMSEIKER